MPPPPSYPPPIPVPNATRPFWRTERHPLDAHRSTKELPTECDILIIGAGYSGIATAYHLLDNQDEKKEPSVVMLEAREACSGATGRNGKIRTTLTSIPIRRFKALTERQRRTSQTRPLYQRPRPLQEIRLSRSRFLRLLRSRQRASRQSARRERENRL